MIEHKANSAVMLMLVVVGCFGQLAAGGKDDWIEADIGGFEVFAGAAAEGVSEDWLVKSVKQKAKVYRGKGKNEIVMSNGLISRTWRLAPNAATVGYDNLMTSEVILRAVKPEAQVEIDGTRFDIGGLKGQRDHAYLLPEWVDELTAEAGAFKFVGFNIGKTKERFAWKRKRWSGNSVWPAPGVSLTLHFKPPAEKLAGLKVLVHYEMYDGIPLLCKWLTVRNGTDKAVCLNSFTGEILAAVEGASMVDSIDGWRTPNMHVESDYEFHGMHAAGANKTVHWVADPEYMTQVNYRRKTPCLLEVRPPVGPEVTISPGGEFESFRVFELIHDSTQREKQGLALRRMYRTIAPWCTENPIMMHVRRADSKSVRLAIDQCAEVGFEMVILTFGSGFNIENEDAGYLAQLKELADYAHSKGIELGGYSLLASRRISDEHDVVNPKTGKPGGFATFGNSPCIGSKWGQDYFRKLYAFYKKTGFDLLEHDGSYPGDVCGSTAHPGHQGLGDSQWKQWKVITDFYKWCRGKGIYLNVPDFYFLSGSNKTGMGYRETNWSLPRPQQIIHGRQNIYDGTWQKTPSMGWMFVPLTQYHGGGAAATIEPLSEHLDAYGKHIANNFGCGVQACYRGPRLYDTDATKALVKKWIDFYKRHRAMLDSDIIHIRRADGRDIDAVLHVNPELEEKGFLMVYNPTNRKIEKKLKLPLYYTGLTDRARIRKEEGKRKVYKLDREYNVMLPIEMDADSVTWFVIE